MISACFHSKPFSITVIQAYVLVSNAEVGEVERFYGDLQNVLELTSKKRCPLHQGWEFKCRKSRDTWSNREVSTWSKK